MSYIGRGVDAISNVEKLTNITFDGSTTYNLIKDSVAFTPSGANNILISIDGIVQQNNFTVAGSTIIFDFSPTSNNTCNWIQHYGVGVLNTPADDTVKTATVQDDAITTDKLANSINSAITANTAKTGITSSQTSAITANTSKTTNATHSGEVTGATALTIADNIVDEANLKISNSATNGHFLSAQSGNSGGLTWAEAGGTLVQTGSMNFLDTNDATSYTVTDCFSTSYDTYLITVYYLPQNDDAYLGMRCTDGSTEHAESLHAFGSRYFDEAGGVGSNTATTATYFKLADSVSNRELDGGATYTLWVTLNRDRTSSQSFRYHGTGMFNDSTSSGRVNAVYVGGGLESAESTDNVTGIKFLAGAGNISIMKVKIYGLDGSAS